MDLDFRRNLGPPDRLGRLSAGLLLFLVPSQFALTDLWSSVAHGIGLLLAAEGIAGY